MLLPLLMNVPRMLGNENRGWITESQIPGYRKKREELREVVSSEVEITPVVAKAIERVVSVPTFMSFELRELLVEVRKEKQKLLDDEEAIFLLMQ